VRSGSQFREHWAGLENGVYTCPRQYGHPHQERRGIGHSNRAVDHQSFRAPRDADIEQPALLLALPLLLRWRVRLSAAPPKGKGATDFPVHWEFQCLGPSLRSG